MCSVLTTGDIVMNKTDKILAPLELNLINKKKKTSRQDNSHSDKCSEENQRCAGIDSEWGGREGNVKRGADLLAET